MKYAFLTACLCMLSCLAQWDQKQIPYAFDSNVPEYAKSVFKDSLQQWSDGPFLGSVTFKEGAGGILVAWGADLMIGIQRCYGITEGNVTTIDGVAFADEHQTAHRSLHNIFLHEIGHLLGLGHSTEVCVMNPEYIQEQLCKPDVDAIRSLYSVPESPLSRFIGKRIRHFPVPQGYSDGFVVFRVCRHLYYFDAVDGRLDFVK